MRFKTNYSDDDNYIGRAIQLCLKDTDLWEKCCKKKRKKDIVMGVSFVVFAIGVFLLNFFLPEEGEMELWQQLVLFGCLLGMMLVFSISEKVWGKYIRRLFDEVKNKLSWNEEDKLKRRLMENVQNYFRTSMFPIVAIIVLFGAMLLISTFQNDNLILLLGALIAFIVLTIIFSVCFLYPRQKERLELIKAIEQLQYNPYDNSELYKNKER